MYVPAYYLDTFSRYIGSSPPLKAVSALRSVKSFMRVLNYRDQHMYIRVYVCKITLICYHWNPLYETSQTTILLYGRAL